jgi:CheY-like chemotaxis protein
MAKMENNINNAKKVMIVDDEPDVISVLEFVLNENGFEVDSFADPIAALKNYKVGHLRSVNLGYKDAKDGWL